MNIINDEYNIQKFTNEDGNILMVYNPDTGEVDFESRLNTDLKTTLNMYIEFFMGISGNMGFITPLEEPEPEPELTEEEREYQMFLKFKESMKQSSPSSSTIQQLSEPEKVVVNDTGTNKPFEFQALHKTPTKVSKPNFNTGKSKTRIN